VHFLIQSLNKIAIFRHHECVRVGREQGAVGRSVWTSAQEGCGLKLASPLSANLSLYTACVQLQKTVHPDLVIDDDAIVHLHHQLYALLAHLCEQSPLVSAADCEAATKNVMPPNLAQLYAIVAFFVSFFFYPAFCFC
jgi:hypothetical protein